MVSKESRAVIREKKHKRLRNRFAGTAERPRLAVFRSNNHMYAQIIDDTVGNTLVAASTLEKSVKAELEKTNNVDAAAYLGTVIAKRALEKGISTVVFDRGGFIYQGKVKALAEAAELIEEARKNAGQIPDRNFTHDGVIVNQSDTLEQYCKKVEKIKQYIREGHIFQTVLSQRWTIETKQTGFELYKELRELNPSPYLYYFNYGEFEVIGSSPEMIVKQQGSRVYTCPIAGTRRRGVDAEEDALLRDELLRDEKERAEHVMLVDLARNDMGRISEFGTVKVTQFMEVQNYSHVMHIVSMVEGKKKGEFHPLDLVSSFLPAGTLSGAPKIRAMEIIDELESVRRGLYGGATGYIDFFGDMDFCITIRTMIKKKNRVYLQAGAGIVADSVPENEYQECCNKVMALAKTLIEEENL